MTAMPLLRNLQGPARPGHAIVAADLTILLNAQHLVQGDTGKGEERAARIGRLFAEPLVVLRNIGLAQINIRGLHRQNPGPAQQRRQPLLQGPEHAFHPAPALRRIGRDVADAQLSTVCGTR